MSTVLIVKVPAHYPRVPDVQGCSAEPSQPYPLCPPPPTVAEDVEGRQAPCCVTSEVFVDRKHLQVSVLTSVGSNHTSEGL